MLLGKHDDFVFEGVKASNKPVKKLVLNSDARKNEAKKSQTAFGMHKEHHKNITKYVFIGVVVLILIIALSKAGYLNFNEQQQKILETKAIEGVSESQQNLLAQALPNPCS